MTTFSGLGGLAAHLLTVKADMRLTEKVILEKTCRMIEKEAKAAIGTYRQGYDWEPLKPETVARKAKGDTPLLETGELRRSIEHNVDSDGKDAYVGTNDPIAKYHEFGTSRIPARSFLGGALMQQEKKIHAMMERTLGATFGGPHYRELHELFHALHMAYESGKELGESVVDEDEQ
jgi:HK97 gp10 family phage protein